MKNVCGFHRHKQSLPKTQLSSARDRLEGGSIKVSPKVLPRRIQKIPQIHMAKKDEEKTTCYTRQIHILLQKNAIWPQESRGNILAIGR